MEAFFSLGFALVAMVLFLVAYHPQVRTGRAMIPLFVVSMIFVLASVAISIPYLILHS